MAENLTFIGYRRPDLPHGDYSISVEQTTSLDAATRFPAQRTFTVASERFALPPTAVRSVFPPDGRLGDHTNVLPHVVLDRPTRPWERSGGPSLPDTAGWLALLVFAEDERPEPVPATLGTLATGPAYAPAPVLETHEKAGDPVTVIDVLASIMPSPGDLSRLAHVRSGDDETAVVIANRLPAAGVTSTVHLVSVEGRYGASGFDLGPDREDALVRLVSLASWRFACVSREHTFPYLARALAGEGRPYRLADSGEPAADDFLRQGYVPVRHALRQGGRTVSWYRGPFVTGETPADPRFGVRTADELLRYHPDAGMFDIGYASAWQLGRLLTLRHNAVATSMATWKRLRAMRLGRAESADHPLHVVEIDDTVPPDVAGYLAGLARLEGVPFRYLVPDERLLPVETIRFLSLDTQWIAHLVDGATSIGRVTSADAERDRDHPPPFDQTRLTGALIRSDIVTGYPTLLIDGYDGAGTLLESVGPVRLSPTIMLCLFKGVLDRLDLHQSPEAQHFGVELPEEDQVAKSLRSADGGPGPTTASIPLGPSATVPIGSLVGAMATALDVDASAIDAAAFAAQMTETAERGHVPAWLVRAAARIRRSAASQSSWGSSIMILGWAYRSKRSSTTSSQAR
jgi:hypothetical protein